jgi:DnaJ domain
VDTHSPEGYYRTLGLAPGASLEEVTPAYTELVKIWHPDRFTQAPHLQQRALEKIQMINHAYTRLRFLRPDLVMPPSPRPPWLWAFRQVRRIRAIPPWLVVLVAFAVLRLGFDHLTLLPDPVLPHKGRLVGEKEDRVERRGILPAWDAPHSRFLPDGQGIEAEAAVTRSSTPEVSTQSDQVNSYFTVGSTKAEVWAVQGPPTRTSEYVWEYGGSRVYFRDGRVSKWDMWPRSLLKVKLLPTAPLEAMPAYFTVGSTKDEVVVVQGTPTRFSDRVWEYGHSRIYFEADRVARWEEWRGSPLKARDALQGEDQSR